MLKNFLVYRFTATKDKARFSNVAVYLQNGYVAGREKFPKYITASQNILEN